MVEFVELNMLKSAREGSEMRLKAFDGLRGEDRLRKGRR